MIKKIKNKIANRKLNKRAENLVRQKNFVNIDDAKNIGVVFDATDSDNFETIKKYVINLKELGKKVHAIGFFDQKTTPTHLSYPKTEFDFFNAHELKSFNEPAGPFIKTFIDDVKDLLIDFNFSNKFPLRYIVANSLAKCKIGIDIQDNLITHDILIAIEGNCSPEKFIQQVDIYLKMLKSNS